MKKKQSSATAEGMALVRAIEASRPENERICYDPLARALVPTLSYTLSKWVIDSGLYARMSQGTMEFIIARERYIDDYLQACLIEGLEQVVILGAGFDTRAYRIAGIEKTRVFEIDHPDTQAEKLKRLKKVIDPIPAHVTYLALDFDTQTLAERLLSPGLGYNEQSKTLFIWQGVTVYLTAPAVDSTLAFISNHSGPDSSVIFDYFYAGFLSDKDNSQVKAMRRAAQVTGEGYLFGIDENQLEPFLSQRGFRDVHSASTDDLKRLYFSGPNAGRVLSRGTAIASARVDTIGM